MSNKRKLVAILAVDVVGYSRLTGEDESATIAVLNDLQKHFFTPAVKQHNGRIVKLMGDGALVEFASAVDAVNCAVYLQTEILNRKDKPKIELRIGVNLGDVLIEGDDLLGDGVNIAARLETISEPGGICISDIVRQSILGKIDIELQDLGNQDFKNIIRPIRVWSWRANYDSSNEKQTPSDSSDWLKQQNIRFCKTNDGVQIAYATVGRGPPLVKAPNWMHHLEYEWKSPIWRHLLKELAADYTLIRFDQRANGLSDWNVDEISLNAFTNDLATVVESLGVEKFPLIGVSQGCATAVKYVAENPGKVSHLILYGGYSRGTLKRGIPEKQEEEKALSTLIRVGWGNDDPALRQFFTSRFIPTGTKEQMDWFNELQRVSVSPENAVRIRESNINTDVTSLLSLVNIPTLVLHCRDDALVPFDEGRRLASMIPNSRFVPLDGNNHLILENEPAWPIFLEEVRNFLASS